MTHRKSAKGILQLKINQIMFIDPYEVRLDPKTLIKK